MAKELHPLLATSIRARCDTWLKRKPVPSWELPPEERVFAPKGCAHQWSTVTMFAGRKHRLVVLQADPDSEWYIWPPHWKIMHDVDPKATDSPIIETPFTSRNEVTCDI